MRKLFAILLCLVVAPVFANDKISTGTASLTVAANVDYTYTGSGTTYTLEAVSTTAPSSHYFKNAGSGTLTINRAGSDTIYNSSSGTSYSLTAGSAVHLFTTQTAAVWYAVPMGGSGGGGLASTDIDTSAELRTILTDEVGTGAAYFVGGALGTPASGTGTNLTGIPISTGVSGLGTGVATALGNNTGSAGAFAVVNGPLGTPVSGSLVNCNNLPPAGVTGTAAILGANTFTAAQTINGGTVTTSTPIIDGSQTWNAVGTTFTLNKYNVTNTASAAGSLFFDYQIGGVSEVSLTKTGLLTMSGASANSGGIAMRGAFITSLGGVGRLGFGTSGASNGQWLYSNPDVNAFTFRSNYLIGWSSSATDPVNNAADTQLSRISAGLVGNTTGGFQAAGDFQTTAGPDRKVIVNRSSAADYGRVVFQNAAAEIYAMGLRGDDGGVQTFSITGPASLTWPTIVTITPGATVTSTFAVNGRLTAPVIGGGTTKTLTESSATAFVQIAAASGSGLGGTITYTVRANDASDYQARSGSVNFAIVNKAGVETITFGTVVNEAAALSTGTLTVAFDGDTSPTNAVNLRANAVSSLTQTGLFLDYRVEMNGTAPAITAQ